MFLNKVLQKKINIIQNIFEVNIQTNAKNCSGFLLFNLFTLGCG